MRRIPEIKKIDYDDPQSVLIEKLNSNFSNIHTLDGGPMGSRGITGPTGPYGINGKPGPTGGVGLRGNRWFVSDFPPLGGDSDTMISGDYWIDSSSSTNNISVFLPSGWDLTTYNLASRSPFSKLNNIDSNFGATGGRAIVYKNSPERSTFSFSDSTLDASNANHEASSLVIPVKGSISGGISLLEFSRGDLNNGSSVTYLKNPTFRFSDSSSSNSDLLFTLPSGGFSVRSREGIFGMDHSISITTVKNLNLFTTNFLMSNSGTAGKGFVISSYGTMSINTPSFFYPEYKNLNYTTFGIIRIYSKFNVSHSDVNSSGIKVNSRIDNVTGTGSISTSFKLGTSSSTYSQRNSNYIFKISSTLPGIGEVNRFYINGNGVIYRERESRKVTRITENGSNLDTSTPGTQRFWCNLGNSTFTNGAGKVVCRGNNTNEVIINPSGVPTTRKLSVGISLITIDNCSYLRNLKEVGETFKIRIRTANPDFPIYYVGITNISSSAIGIGGAYPPSLKREELQTPCAFVDFIITKEALGNSGNRISYRSSSGQVGFFTT